MTARRYVLDTNILISAALMPGKPFQVLQHVLETSVVIFSNETFEEILTRLMRPEFDRYISQATRQRFLTDLEAVADWTAITGALRACRDADDDKILETALAAGAECIVIGDQDLLLLHPFQGVAIMTPEAFLTATTR